MPKKKLADAKTEAEEALWFEKNQDRLLKLFKQAEREGALRIGGRSIGITVSKRTGSLMKPPAQKVMLRIPVDDLERARQQAADKGIGYQMLMKMLLHEALSREETSKPRRAG
ncbi:MAG: CopG family antitoxin [Bryobacterales bacterium]|nr:CopG family antitoxin [Bryobacterales bacterium]